VLVYRRFGEPLRLDFQIEVTEQHSDVYVFYSCRLGLRETFCVLIGRTSPWGIEFYITLYLHVFSFVPKFFH
jgi:hypothetical protein